MNPPKKKDAATLPLVRCAIYTRKSTEEGLEQEFNSLDAQRESAEAFIRSQTHEGWTCLPERYDDGGFTGGNMESPCRLPRTLPRGRPADRALSRLPATAGCEQLCQFPRLGVWQRTECAPRRTRAIITSVCWSSCRIRTLNRSVHFAPENHGKSWVPALKIRQ